MGASTQGLRARTAPPSCNWRCRGLESDFQDFRFLKDVDWEVGPMCCCFCERRMMRLSFDTDNPEYEDGVRDITIIHPDMTDEQVGIIKNAWAEARLVSD